MELILNGEDQELLSNILERRLRELQKEISRTDHREFKELLRGNENRIESMLDRLGLRVSASAS